MEKIFFFEDGTKKPAIIRESEKVKNPK